MNNNAFLSPLFRLVENVSVKRKVYKKNICVLCYTVNIFRKFFIFILIFAIKLNTYNVSNVKAIL
ncbi:hypothetical protein C3943_05860 [Lysinibacillus sp. B2A1]|nr:hypothetical protein C3943_05860 [Lysinibacillus sp. B2A1]